MRDREERVGAVLRRTAELERRDRRRAALLGAASVAACLALITALSFAMPCWAARVSASTETEGVVSASLFSAGSLSGYLVIGILAFFLGAAVTILCFRLRRWSRAGNETP